MRLDHMSFVLLVSYSTLLAALPSPAHAQLIRSYGLTVGAVLADQPSEYPPFTYAGVPARDVPARSLWGFNAGVFIELFTDPYFGVLTDLRYTQRGRIVTVQQTAPANNDLGYIDLGPADITQRFHFLEITIMPKVRLEGATITPFLASGPSFDILVDHPFSAAPDKYTDFQIGISVMAGAEFSFGFTPRLVVNLRYVTSFTNAYDSGIVTIHNRAIEFNLGVAL